MMYRLDPTQVSLIIDLLSLTDDKTKFAFTSTVLKARNDLLEQFKSIQAVMVSSNQDYVYIVGRDPNKL